MHPIISLQRRSLDEFTFNSLYFVVRIPPSVKQITKLFSKCRSVWCVVCSVLRRLDYQPLSGEEARAPSIIILWKERRLDLGKRRASSQELKEFFSFWQFTLVQDISCLTQPARAFREFTSYRYQFVIEQICRHVGLGKMSEYGWRLTPNSSPLLIFQTHSYSLEHFFVSSQASLES